MTKSAKPAKIPSFRFPAYTAETTVVMLAAIYNSLVDADHQIKKFSTKPEGLRRVAALHREALIEHLEAHHPSTAVLINDEMDVTALEDLLVKAQSATTTAEVNEPVRSASRQGVGAAVLAWLTEGFSTDQIVGLLGRTFPDSAPGRDPAVARKHIAWYRGKMAKAKAKAKA